MSAIEQRARELLAVELEKDGNHPAAKAIRDGEPAYGMRLQLAAIRAIIAALTPPEGYVLVPVEPTKEMVSAAADAYMPFGDMEFAIQAAISSRPEAK